jgi:Flp pilus assembly protein TadD
MSGDGHRAPGIAAPAVLFGALLLAVILRLEYLRELILSPFGRHVLLDAEWYDQAARMILDGTSSDEGRPYFRAPLYPLLLAGLYRLFDGSLLAPRLVQASLGVLQVILVRDIARRTHGEPSATIATFLAATYGMFIFFEGEILTTSIGTFLLASGTVLLLKADRIRSLRLFALGGLMFGLAAITHGTAAPLGSVAVLWAFGRRRAWGAATLVALGFLVPIGAVTARNLTVSGEFVPIGSRGGINFYIGNNGESDGKSALAPGFAEAEQVIRPGEKYRDSVEIAAEAIAEREIGRPLTAGEIDRYWYSRAIEWMRDHPKAAVIHQFRKAVFFWNGYEISNNRDLRDQARRHTPILRFFLAQLSVILPFAIFGIIRGGLATRPRRLLAGLLLAHTVTIVAFFVCARFRQPSIVWLLPFAAAGSHRAVDAVRAGRIAPGRLARTGLVLASLFVLTNGSLITRAGIADVTSDRDAPFHRFNLAVLYEREGDLDRAIEEYRAAASTGVPDPRIWLNLGNCLARTARVDEAREAYRQTLRLAPDYEAVVSGNLGILAAQEKDWEEAIRRFERCLALDPRDVQALTGVAAAYLSAGRLDEAVVAFRRALAAGAGPENAIRRSLAVAYLHSGLLDEAEKECRAVLRRDPEDVTAVLILGRVHLQQGREEEARALWATARRLAPGSPAVERAITEARVGID